MRALPHEVIDRADAAPLDLQHLDGEQMRHPVVVLSIERGRGPAAGLEGQRPEEARRERVAYAMGEEARDRVAALDPGRSGRHRECHLFVEQGDDRVEVARLPYAHVALEERA